METILLQIPNANDKTILLDIAKRLDCKIASFEVLDTLEKEEDKEKDSISLSEIQLELAIFLFLKRVITLELGSKLSGLDIVSFQKELGKRKIPLHYDVADFEQDIKTLQKLNRI